MKVSRVLRGPNGCPSHLDLSRAVSSGPGALSAHLKSCLACAESWRDLLQPRELARELPWVSPSAAELDQTRANLMQSLAEQRAAGVSRTTSRRLWRGTIAFTMSLAVAVAVIAAWRLSPPSQNDRMGLAAGVRTYHAMVTPRPGATFEDLGNASDDVVRLHDGAATFDVFPLTAGQRFRVVAGNGEVEVRGTSFEVKVVRDRLAIVHVQHGRVEVRVDGRSTVVLGAGGDWAEPSASEDAFVEAWSAFRAGHLTDSIEAFDEVLRLAPSGPLSEDSHYWKAVALARTGSRHAIDELAGFLRGYPGSAHADDASVILGWKLLEAGRRNEAMRSFQAGLEARAMETRKSARAGIDQLGR